jgi:hypothetical protein
MCHLDSWWQLWCKHTCTPYPPPPVSPWPAICCHWLGGWVKDGAGATVPQWLCPWGRAVVVCHVSGLRNQGHCGVEAHGHRSCVVALGGGFQLALLAVGCWHWHACFQGWWWYFSVGWHGVALALKYPFLRLVVLCCSAGVVTWRLGASVVLVVGLGVMWLWLCCSVAVLGQLVWAIMTWQAVAYLWGLWWLVVRLLGVSRVHLVGLSGFPLSRFLLPCWHPACLTSLEQGGGGSVGSCLHGDVVWCIMGLLNHGKLVETLKKQYIYITLPFCSVVEGGWLEGGGGQQAGCGGRSS